MKLFATRPYDEIRIEQIAKQASVSRGLLYHYFPTKRDFYVEVVGAAVAQVAELTEPDAELPPLERLRAAVDAYLNYAEQHSHAVLTTHGAGIGSDVEVRAIIDEGQHRQALRILEQVAEGAGDPEELPPILYEAVRGWLGLLVTMTVGWLERRYVERDAIREMLVNAFVSLVAAARHADPELDRILPPPLSE